MAAEEDAERLAGAVVRAARARDTVTISTRVPIETDPFGMEKHGVPVDWVQTCIEASLRATKLDAIGVAQIAMRHEWRTAAESGRNSRATCARLVREGKVMRWSAVAANAAIVPRDPEEPPPPSPLDAPWIVAMLDAVLDVRAHRGAAGREDRARASPASPAGCATAGALGPNAKSSPAIKDDRRAVDEPMLVRYAISGRSPRAVR